MSHKVRPRQQPQPARTHASSSRRSIHHPKNGLGFAHGSAKVDTSRAYRALVRLAGTGVDIAAPDPRPLTITVGTSSSGSVAANKRLMEQRVAAVKKMLRSYGFKGPLTVIRKRTPPGQPDRAEDRAVTFAFSTAKWPRASSRDRCTCSALQQLLRDVGRSCVSR